MSQYKLVMQFPGELSQPWDQGSSFTYSSLSSTRLKRTKLSLETALTLKQVSKYRQHASGVRLLHSTPY